MCRILTNTDLHSISSVKFEMTAVCTASIRHHVEFVKDVLEAISKLNDASGGFNKQQLE